MCVWGGGGGGGVGAGEKCVFVCMRGCNGLFFFFRSEEKPSELQSR